MSFPTGKSDRYVGEASVWAQRAQLESLREPLERIRLPGGQRRWEEGGPCPGPSPAAAVSAPLAACYCTASRGPL